MREVIALLMALDPVRYPIDNAVGIENAYARLSSMFSAYLKDPAPVERFGAVAVDGMHLYEHIRRTAPEMWTSGRFKTTKIAEVKKSGTFQFPFSFDQTTGRPHRSDVRLIKAAAVPCFAAFRLLIDVPEDESEPVSWRYPFEEVKQIWDENGEQMLREVHEAVMRQHGGNTHYAGRSPSLYRATSRTVEVADLRRRIRSV